MPNIHATEFEMIVQVELKLPSEKCVIRVWVDRQANTCGCPHGW